MGDSLNPYAPPRSDAAGHGARRHVYRAAGWKTKAASIGLVGSVVVGLALGVMTMAMPPPGQARDMGLVALFGALGLLATAWSLGTTVMFLVWTHQASTNAHALRPDAIEHSPSWAVWSWFVPIVSLYVPYRALAELWRASDPETVGTESTTWVASPIPSLFPLWWGTYLASSFLSTFAALGPIMTRGHVAPNEAGGGTAGLVANFFLAIAAVALVSIMRQLDRRQEYCAEKLARQ